MERIALRQREAAQKLGLSVRTLWDLTRRGLIPHRRVGRAVLYSVRELEDWARGEHRNQEGAP